VKAKPARGGKETLGLAVSDKLSRAH